MEAEEDGIVLVIIGDDVDQPETVSPGSEQVPARFTIKQEPQEEQDSLLHVEELLKTAEKHGEHIDVNNLPFLTKIKQEPFVYEYLEEEYPPDSQNDDDLSGNPSDTVNEFICDIKPRKNIRKMLDPTERQSYVKILRREHPELLNSQALVQLLANTMKSIKPPPPPPDFYRIHGLDFECALCDRTLTSLATATRHYHEHHGPLYLKCFACGADFRSTTNLYKHEKRCAAPDAVTVLRARALVVAGKGRNRPFVMPKEKKKKIINNLVLKCPECSADFRTKLGLTSHLYLHRGERPFACEFCAAAYTNKTALRRHQELHKNNKYVCDHCHREFRMKMALQYHMDTHLPQRKFPCPFLGCGRRYAQKNALNIHINGRHKNLPPPCPCQLCPKRFPRMSVLKMHMKKEHGMILMTRNMFFKSLPRMSHTLVKRAKLVFNEGFEGLLVAPKDEPETISPDIDIIDEEIVEKPHLELLNRGEMEDDAEHVLTHVENLLKENGEGYSEGGNILVIENGRVKNISKKSKFRKHYEKMIAEASNNQKVEGTSMLELS